MEGISKIIAGSRTVISTSSVSGCAEEHISPPNNMLPYGQNIVNGSRYIYDLVHDRLCSQANSQARPSQFPVRYGDLVFQGCQPDTEKEILLSTTFQIPFKYPVRIQSARLGAHSAGCKTGWVILSEQRSPFSLNGWHTMPETPRHSSIQRYC